LGFIIIKKNSDMKQSKIIVLVLSTFTIGLTACLKERDMNTDPDKTPYVVEFANTGNNTAAAASKYPGFFIDLGTLQSGASTSFNVNVNYAGAGNAPEDVTVNLGLDPALLATYNTDNGTAYETPPSSIINVPSSVVIKKGEKMAQAKISITNNASFDFSKSYGIPLKINSVSKGTISNNFGKAVYSFGVRNIYDGHYSMHAYTLRAGDPAKTGSFVDPAGMDLVTAGKNIVQFGTLQVWTDLTGVGIGNPVFTVNADNSVTASSSGGAMNAPGYNSRYDPTTKTFYVSFTWGAGPASRLAIDTLKYLGPR